MTPTMIHDLVVFVLPSLLLSLLAAGGLYGLRRMLRWDLDADSQGVVTTLTSFVSTLFAFVLGFVLVSLWDNYRAAESLVSTEANHVRAMYRVAEHMPEGARLRAQLSEYASALAEDEWPAMTHARSSPRADALKDDLWRTSLEMVSAKGALPALSSKLLDSLDGMNKARRDRLEMLSSALHPLLLLALGVTGICTVVGVFLLGIKRKATQFLVDVLVILCILLNLALLHALDRPFNGSGFTVSNEPLAVLAQRMAAENQAAVTRR